MKNSMVILVILFFYSCSTNMIFDNNKTYRIINVEGKATDIQKLFYLIDIQEISFDSLYIKYDKDGYNNCFIYSKHILVSEFKLKKSVTKRYFIAENYFPLEKMGYSFKDSTQFQYQLFIEKDESVTCLIFDNVEKHDYEWLKGNQLDQKLIITLEEW